MFTGGIGERAAPVRERVCAGLEHLGVEIDPRRRGSEAISTAASRVAVFVVKTDEDLVMARHARKVLGA